jgi:hypothetical protein
MNFNIESVTVAEILVLGGNIWTRDYIRYRRSEKWVMKIVIFVLSIRYDLTHEMGWICKVNIALSSWMYCKSQ